MRTDEREQPLLARATFLAGLGEAGGDDAERADTLAQRRLGRVEHLSARHADHGELDLIRNLLDRGVAAYAGDGLA